MLFLAGINLIASLYNAALPAMLLSKEGGGQAALGIVESVLRYRPASWQCDRLPPAPAQKPGPRDLQFPAAGHEHGKLFLALGGSVPVWAVGALLGWIGIPLMNANMDVLFRSTIPLAMQGRVYAARNTLQFFTIPVGYFLGGFLVDSVMEPFRASQAAGAGYCPRCSAGEGAPAPPCCFSFWQWLERRCACCSAATGTSGGWSRRSMKNGRKRNPLPL